MLPFRVEIRLGEPPYEQLIFSIKKAIADGHLKTGDKLPSVRAFSKELRINPNTVQKALTVLINDGMLEVRPGIGSIVSDSFTPNQKVKDALLDEKLETLIVEAKHLGISKDQLREAIDRKWK